MEKEAVKNSLSNDKNIVGTVLKLVIRFVYIFLLFSFFNITFAYVGGIGGFDKIFTMQNIFGVSLMVSVLAITVTLSSWKWYVGAIFADIIAFFVNTGLEGGGYNFGTLGFTLMELPVFLGIAAVIYFINKGYEKIPKRWIQLTIVGLPFVIFLLLIIGASLTCSFGNNSVCVAKGSSSSDVTACRKSSSLGAEMDCYKEFAKKINDPNVCNSIEGNQYYEMCLRAFIMESSESISPNSCDSAPDKKINNCLRILGITLKDPKICEKIPESDGYNLYKCYNGIVWSGGDKALCDKVLNAASKRSCLNPDNMGYYDR